jgi:hypothetical protein
MATINPNDIATLDVDIQPVDHRELDHIRDEYISLALADLTDDVDCSISTMQARNERLDDITSLVGEELANEWSNIAEMQAKEHGFASGKEYKGEL